jgi:hypothetical protein
MTETDRLFRKLTELFEEDNAMYPANDDGSTTIPADKLKAWCAATLMMAAVATLKGAAPWMPSADVPAAARKLRKAAIAGMIAEAENLDR